MKYPAIIWLYTNGCLIYRLLGLYTCIDHTWHSVLVQCEHKIQYGDTLYYSHNHNIPAAAPVAIMLDYDAMITGSTTTPPSTSSAAADSYRVPTSGQTNRHAG